MLYVYQKTSKSHLAIPFFLFLRGTGTISFRNPERFRPQWLRFERGKLKLNQATLTEDISVVQAYCLLHLGLDFANKMADGSYRWILNKEEMEAIYPDALTSQVLTSQVLASQVLAPRVSASRVLAPEESANRIVRVGEQTASKILLALMN